jgi:hypothetical protein
MKKKQHDVKKILDQNPHIDPQELKKSLEVLEELKKMGVNKAEYDLETPFSRKLTPVGRHELTKAKATQAN